MPLDDNLVENSLKGKAFQFKVLAVDVAMGSVRRVVFDIILAEIEKKDD